MRRLAVTINETMLAAPIAESAYKAGWGGITYASESDFRDFYVHWCS